MIYGTILIRMDNLAILKNDIRVSFAPGMAVVEKWTRKCEENTIHLAAAILDQRFKTTLIREQYKDDTDAIIERVRNYLKKEFKTSAKNLSKYSDEPPIPHGADLHYIGLLRRARYGNTPSVSRY
jgi:hypothetical protein